MNAFKVIIAGSRTFDDCLLLEDVMDNVLKEKRLTHTITIISGTANGADKLGEIYAGNWDYALERYPADWAKYGKSAGYKRNQLMATKADALVAFSVGNSRGTAHMIDIAIKGGLDVRVIRRPA